MKGSKHPFNHALACSIEIPDSAHRKKDTTSSSPDLMHFTPIDVESYEHLAMFDDDGSYSEEEDLPHLVSFLCASGGYSSSFRSPPRTPFVIELGHFHMSHVIVHVGHQAPSSSIPPPSAGDGIESFPLTFYEGSLLDSPLKSLKDVG